MKKHCPRILYAFCLTVFFAFSACAAQGGYTGPGPAPGKQAAQGAVQGGYTGPGPTVVSVKDAKQLRDDTPVCLRGVIERHLGDNKYQFRDATGTITVEIGRRKWEGQSVGATDQVELRGEVDKDWDSIKIDVTRVIKLAK